MSPTDPETRGPREIAYATEISDLVDRLRELSFKHDIPMFLMAELDAEPGGKEDERIVAFLASWNAGSVRNRDFIDAVKAFGIPED